jgi:hypothetical protein
MTAYEDGQGRVMNRAQRRRHARQNRYRIRVGRGIPQTGRCW